MKRKFILLPITLTTLTPMISMVACDNNVTFEKDSWKNICKYANLGFSELKKHYHVDSFVGKTKNITFFLEGFYYQHKILVIDENRDVTEDGKKCALTLQLKNVVSGDGNGKVWLTMYKISNSGTWHTSSVRNSVIKKMTEGLPKIISDNVKFVYKKCFNEEGTDVDNNLESYFLPSLSEIWPIKLIKNVRALGKIIPIDNADKYSLEGEQYAYYRNIVNKETGVKQSETVKNRILDSKDGKEHPSEYWLRTKTYGSTKTSEDIPLSYYDVAGIGILDRYDIEVTRRSICPIFCI